MTTHSPFPEKPKGMHWETLRLEQKNLEADREKLRILYKQISSEGPESKRPASSLHGAGAIF
jgi:hypothetical protein